jgi:hypothetical protein
MRISRVVGVVAVMAVGVGLTSGQTAFGSESGTRRIVVRERGFESFVGDANVAGVVHATVTRFGRGVEAATSAPCVNPNPIAICIDVVVHFPHDTLRWHDEGVLFAWTGPAFPGIVHIPGPPFPNVGAINRFAEVVTITGGTGRFAGATGHLTSRLSESLIVQSDPATGFVKKRVNTVDVGTITLPDVPDHEHEHSGDDD